MTYAGVDAHATHPTRPLRALGRPGGAPALVGRAGRIPPPHDPAGRGGRRGARPALDEGTLLMFKLFTRRPQPVFTACGLSRQVVVTDDAFVTITVRGAAWW